MVKELGSLKLGGIWPKKKNKKQKKKSILLRRDSFWERCTSPKALEFKD